MSRPAIVYVVMILVLVGGLSAVLEIGGYLAAPEDLAGRWQITPMGSVPTDFQGPGLNIEQSGEFFQIRFDKGPQLDMKLQAQAPAVLIGDPWKLTLSGHVGADDKILQLQGPQQGMWTAHRLVRTFPPDTASKGGT